MANIRQQVKSAREEGYSDEEIISFLSEADPRISQAVSEGYTLDQVSNYVDPITFAESAMPETQLLSQVPRQVGLTARSGIEAVGGLADFLATPFRGAVNLVAPEGLKAPPMASRVADALRLPQPETDIERISGRTATGMASAATGFGAAGLAKPISEGGKFLQQLLRSAPSTQIASGGTSGAASSIAQEMGFGDTGQMVAGIFGGLAPAAVPALATRTAASVPAQTKQIISESREAGYTLPPSQTNPSLTNKIIESLSGKIKTNQSAAQKNQEVTNNLSKKALGIPKDQPLTIDTLKGIRSAAGRAYDELESIGNVSPSKSYFDKLDEIVDPYVKAASGFPEAKPNPIISEIGALKSTSFPASAGVAKIRELRESADTAYASGNKALGASYKKAAEAIEDALENQAVRLGNNLPSDLVKNFREARKIIAKTYSVQRALNDASGNVVATNLAAQLKRGSPLEGDLRTIAKTAQAFPKSVQSVDQIAQSLPLSPLDFGTAVLGYGTLGGFGTAGLVARPAARAAILSKPYQATLGRPGGIFASKTKTPEELMFGGLLGTQYGMEQ
jgi:hypothetical protein